jgi:dephospho-CoA kinase
MPKIIGITGGIGSGKTTLIEFIKENGFFVYISDEESKKILNNKEIINKIQFSFPDYVLVVDNLLDKRKLAEIVFNNPEYLKKLNALIHPLVQKDFEAWVKGKGDQKILFKETAILFETGAYKQCDYNILITAPVETRIARVMQRDGVTKEQVLERINNQWSDDEKAKLADVIVENIDLTTAKQEILNIINKLT